MYLEKKHVGDDLSEAGAQTLAAQIAAFWRRCGHHVSVWIEPFGSADRNGRSWWVRSSLVGGLPAEEQPQPKKKAA